MVAWFLGTPGGGELLVIFAVALMLFGAKRLPELARSLGRFVEAVRRAVHEVSEEIHRPPDDSVE